MRKVWSAMKGVILVSLLGGAWEAFAGYAVRCNAKQTRCEIKTKRVHIRDYMGIFDEDGNLAAISRVSKISGGTRQLKVTKKFSKIKKGYKATLISDNEARNPKKYFTFLRGSRDQTAGAYLGLTSMGVGEEIRAFEAGGYGEWAWKDSTKFVAHGAFLRGSGVASSTEEALTPSDLTFMALVAMGGVGVTLAEQKSVSVRTSFTLGLAYVSASVSDGGDVKEVVDGRIFPGIGAAFRASADVLVRMDDMTPFAGMALFKIQNSIDYTILGGLRFAM